MSARLLLKRMLLAFTCTLLTAAGALAQRVDPELQSVFSRLPAGGTAEVIVTFHGSSAPSAPDLEVLKAVGIPGGVTFRALPMVGTVATLEQVSALAASPRVRSVFHNKQLQYFNHEATQLTGVQRLRADAAITRLNRGLPVTGKGVGVLINDSGIDAMHPDLKLGKNVVQNVWGPIDYRDLAATGFQPFIVAEDQPNSDNGGSGHGTHVAGTVGGTGQASAGKQAGVAPGASLVGFGSGATIFVLNSVGGFDYALANQGRYGIRIITNSWGSAGGFNPDHPVNVASRIAAEQRNMVVLFAAGNSGSAPDTHNPYAKAPWVISVAAGNKDGTLADFSSRGTPGGPKTVTSASGEVITWLDEPTITAPGVDIVSAKASVSDGVPEADNPYYTMMEGTSMSTPHVAGIVALMLEANPLLTPAEVKQILKETATKMPDALPSAPYRSFEVGAGYANAYAAVQKAFELSTPFGKPLQGYEVLGRVQASVLFERTFDYSPASLPGAYKHSFQVAPGTDRIEVDIRFNGVDLPAYGNAGNPLLLDVYDPNGNRYVGFDVYFAIYGTTRLVVVANNPTPGTWTAEVKALTPLGNEA
ncbi:MAG TPA: S8 family serine peptidase, partial [Longimicrobiaceae bacterium]|nr:S8 family serine peptidase [Longimicrobiaceae bacterium]